MHYNTKYAKAIYLKNARMKSYLKFYSQHWCPAGIFSGRATFYRWVKV